MRIGGLQPLSLLDFPGKLAATIFTLGCNLCCPFCHNGALVNRRLETPEPSVKDILSFLESRRGLLDGVVLSGGEPLLQEDAAHFLGQIRALGFAVKLDTNGCFPKALQSILEQGLVDYVAMDVKSSRASYPKAVGIPGFDVTPVEESLRLLQSSGVDYELRTTVVQELHTAQEIQAIGHWCAGAPRYFLQQFVDSGNLVGGGCSAPNPLFLKELAQIAQPFFDKVGIRGID